MSDRELLFWCVVLQLATATLLVAALDLLTQRTNNERHLDVYRATPRRNPIDTTQTSRDEPLSESPDAEESQPKRRKSRPLYVPE